MINAKKARTIAEAKAGRALGSEREIREGWFFGWGTNDGEIGCHGFVVNKHSGAVFALGSAFPVERDLAMYDLGYHFDRYDLVITAIHDLDATRRAIGRLRLSTTTPEYEDGQVWRIAKTMTDLERWKRLDRLPCIFDDVSLYFELEVLEEARRARSFEFVALGVQSAMSQIHYRDVTLEQVLERAHIALVVRLAEPAHRNEQIPFVGSTWNGESAPDFVRSFTRLEVIEVLAKNARVRAGEIIEVESADAGARERMHDDYYRKGLSRSPIFEHFKGVTLDRTPAIALVQDDGEHFSWVVDTSALAMSERSRFAK